MEDNKEIRGLEDYCKSDFIDPFYLKQAKGIIMSLKYYQTDTMSKKLWDAIKYLISSKYSKAVLNIIKEAAISFGKTEHSPEETKLVNIQLEVFNKMIKQAVKENKEEKRMGVSNRKVTKEENFDNSEFKN